MRSHLPALVLLATLWAGCARTHGEPPAGVSDRPGEDLGATKFYLAMWIGGDVDARLIDPLGRTGMEVDDGPGGIPGLTIGLEYEPIPLDAESPGREYILFDLHSSAHGEYVVEVTARSETTLDVSLDLSIDGEWSCGDSHSQELAVGDTLRGALVIAESLSGVECELSFDR